VRQGEVRNASVNQFPGPMPEVHLVRRLLPNFVKTLPTFARWRRRSHRLLFLTKAFQIYETVSYVVVYSQQCNASPSLP